MIDYKKTHSSYGGADMLIIFDKEVNASVNAFYDDYFSKEITLKILFVYPHDLNIKEADVLTVVLANEFGSAMYKEYRILTLKDRQIQLNIEDTRFHCAIYTYKYEYDENFKEGKPDWIIA